MFRKLRERATTFVSWEKWPKKAGAYPKRKLIQRGKKNQKWSWIWSNSTNTTIKCKEVYISV
jgi:hypothetical protein